MRIGGLCLLASGAVASAALGKGTQGHPTFSAHIEKHKLSFSVDEYSAREAVFLENVRKIETHNQQEKKTFTMGVNKFSHLTAAEFAAHVGGGSSSSSITPAASKPVPQWMLEVTEEDRKIQIQSKRSLNNVVLPENLDWYALGAVTEVKDQGACGSSWAFAATGALEGAYFRKYAKLPFDGQSSPDTGFFGLSEQQLLACEQINSGCFVGGAAQYGFMFAADNYGLSSEYDFPYTSGVNPTDVGQCAYVSTETDTQVMPEKPFVNIVPTVSNMMQALFRQPIAITINAMNPAFQSYNFGTISDASLCPDGDAAHNALLTGWGVDENYIPYWLVKNSWGADWGDQGYIYILRSDDNVCGVLNQGTYPILAPSVDSPTSLPTVAPSLPKTVVVQTMATTPGLTAATCTVVAGSTLGDASTVVIQQATLTYKDTDASATTTTITAAAFKIAGYPCNPSQCLWAFVHVDDVAAYSTTIFPMYVVNKGASVCAYLQAGFQVSESIPVNSAILQYYMNGYYLNKVYWTVPYSSTLGGVGYSLSGIKYGVVPATPTLAPTLVPTAKPTLGSAFPQSALGTGWWIVSTYADKNCNATSLNSIVVDTFGKCTMDVQNAQQYLFWYVDTVTTATTSSVTYQRVYYDDSSCTGKSAAGPTNLAVENKQTLSYGTCEPGSGAYQSFVNRYTTDSTVPSAKLSSPGYIQATYTTNSVDCGVLDLTSFNLYASNKYCYTYSNRSVTYECDGVAPFIKYFSTSDCTGIFNKQAYAPQCAFSVDYYTKSSVACGTTPPPPQSVVEPSITGYLQTISYSDSLCQTPTTSVYDSYGLCLKKDDSTYTITTLLYPSIIRAQTTTSYFSDAACSVRKAALVATPSTAVPLKMCTLTSASTSTLQNHVAGASLPQHPIYAGAMVTVYRADIPATNTCAPDAVLYQHAFAISACVPLSNTTSMILTCEGAGGAATVTLYDSPSCAAAATKEGPLTIPAQTCGTVPTLLQKVFNRAYAFPVSLTATCMPFPKPAIVKYLSQSMFYGDSTCSKDPLNPESVLYTSLGLCTKTNHNNTYYTMTIPGNTSVVGAVSIVDTTTVQFTNEMCSVDSLFGVPFRRMMKLDSCVLSGQDVYMTMKMVKEVPVDFFSGTYTRTQSQIVGTGTTPECSTAKALSIYTVPVEKCVTMSATMSVMIMCLNGKTQTWMYSSPACTASKKHPVPTNATTNVCKTSTDTDYTFLTTDEVITCTQPKLKLPPTAVPTRAPASNKTNLNLPDTINGWITTAHFDSDSCTFATDFAEASYGLCLTGAGVDNSIVYYQESLSPSIYINKLDSTRRYYYLYRTYYTDDKCTTMDKSIPQDKVETEYYKCTPDDSGKFAKTLLVRNGATKPTAPSNLDTNRSFTYAQYNAANCAPSFEISQTFLPEQSCNLIVTENGTYAYQKVACVGNASHPQADFVIYSDKFCKRIIEHKVYPLMACVEYGGAGQYTKMSCPFSGGVPTPAPIPASAPTNVIGEIQGWLTTFMFDSSAKCKASSEKNSTLSLVSTTNSYGLCIVSNYTNVMTLEYTYQITTAQLVVPGKTVQLQTSYYSDDLCSTPSLRYKDEGQLVSLSDCTLDAGFSGLWAKQYFTPGFLEPSEYPSIPKGYQVTYSSYPDCPVERELSSKTLRVGSCLRLSEKQSAIYACDSENPYGAGTIQYTYANTACTGKPVNTTTIDPMECESHLASNGELYWLTSHCEADYMLNHRVTPSPAGVTGWVSTVYYEDANCLYPQREMSVSFGLCTLSPKKTTEGDDMYTIDVLGVPSDDKASVPVATYYYSDVACYSPYDESTADTYSIKLYPQCTSVGGFFITSEVAPGNGYPPSYMDGGFKYTTFSDESAGMCPENEVVSQLTVLGDSTCVKTSGTTAVKYACSQFDHDQSTGLKISKIEFPCADCKCDATNSTLTSFEPLCGTTTGPDGVDHYYTAVCDIKFPVPTLAPLPAVQITSWFTTTLYSDADCANVVNSVVTSSGVCYAVNAAMWAVDKVDFDNEFGGYYPMTTFYFSDADCTTSDPSMEDFTSSVATYTCNYLGDLDLYQTVTLVESTDEPPAALNGGFIYNEYTTSSCDAGDKNFANYYPLKECFRTSADNSTFYKLTCVRCGTTTCTNTYEFSTPDCSGTGVKLSSVPLKKCAEVTASDTAAISYVTTVCLNSFASPTPAPVASLDLQVEGWFTDIIFDDDACTSPAAYMSAYAVGPCTREAFNTDAGVSVYSTTQLNTASTDQVKTVKYFYTSSDCTGEEYQSPEKETTKAIDSCQKIQYGTLPPVSHRLRFVQGAALPTGPFTGGYFYTEYSNENCKAADATKIFAAYENNCIKYYNSTHYVSSAYQCSDDGLTATIFDYDDDACTSDPRSTVQKLSQCSALDSGFYSLQCVAKFAAPTPSPVPAATIYAWVAVDSFGDDDSCGQDGEISSSATSYGLCLPTSFTSTTSLYSYDQLGAYTEGDVLIPLTTYYFTDPDCTIDSGEAPSTGQVRMYDCEKDDTGSYVVSYYVSGPTVPNIPYSDGYAVTAFDSDSCFASRQISYDSAASTYCVPFVNDATKTPVQIYSYSATCSSSGDATLLTYTNNKCSGTPVKSVDKRADCVPASPSDPSTSYYSVECGTFASPTAAPTPMVPLEIDGWVATTFYATSDCDEEKKDEFAAISYGLCMEVYEETTETVLYYVQNLVYDPAKPNFVDMPVMLFDDSDCAQPTDEANYDKQSLRSNSTLNTCFPGPDGTSYKNTVKVGPVPPSSGWVGGFTSTSYNTDTCDWAAITSIQTKPNHIVCTTETTGAGTTSYQIECAALGGAVVYTWDDADCGQSSGTKPSSNYVISKQDCSLQQSSGVTTYVSTQCVDTFLPGPTGPPAPAPAPAAVEGWLVEETYEDDECSVLDALDAYSTGLCVKAFNSRVNYLGYRIIHASVDGNTATMSTFFYADSACTLYRDEKDVQTLSDLGKCQDKGDGMFYRQTWKDGSEPPASPFSGGIART